MKPGDIVTVKGFGNPVMTISRMVGPYDSAVNEYDSADCIWFDAGDNLHRGVFPLAVLEPVDSPA